MTTQNVWRACEGIFDLDEKGKRVTEIEKLEGAPGFWEDQQKAQELLKEKGNILRVLGTWEDLSKELEEIEILLEIAEVEDGGESTEARERLAAAEKKLKALELERMFADRDDPRNVIVSINASKRRCQKIEETGHFVVSSRIKRPKHHKAVNRVRLARIYWNRLLGRGHDGDTIKLVR